MAQHDYRFTLFLRRFDSDKWLPMAINTREEVDAMITHCLGAEGDFDVARITARIPGLNNVFADTGERHTRKIIADPVLR